MALIISTMGGKKDDQYHFITGKTGVTSQYSAGNLEAGTPTVLSIGAGNSVGIDIDTTDLTSITLTRAVAFNSTGWTLVQNDDTVDTTEPTWGTAIDVSNVKRIMGWIINTNNANSLTLSI